MLRTFHKLMVSNSLTRGIQRGVVHRLKSSMGCPDAFLDLRNLIQKHQPEAFLDIGTHIGKTIARVLESNTIRIHGFEPTPQSFEKASSRFAGNDQVSIHNLALSNETGTAEFNINSNEQTNSLLKNDEGNEESLGEHTQHLTTQTVQTMKLDEWMEKNIPAGNIIIKSDVQGAEGMLLEGGEDTFRNRVIAVYSEAQIGAMYQGQMDFCKLHQKLTGDFGFVLHNIYPCLQDRQGRALQTDMLWIKEDFLAAGD